MRYLLSLAALAFASWASAANDNIQVLARGPVHEAYATPVDLQAGPGAVVGKQPPAPIEELPPDQRPAGDDVQWVPGYWMWDDERNDYIWVSGFWRQPPPGRAWVPGTWQRQANGFQWTPGFWSGSQQSTVQYLPQPPAQLDNGPVLPAPNDASFYVPGCWTWRDRYLWRPGYWCDHRPGWVWSPAHYLWSPGGYVHVDGFWDYSLRNRGVLYAPVAFNPGFVQPGFLFTPNYCVYDSFVTSALFHRRGWSGYFFGDYFTPQYQNLGFSPWYNGGFAGGGLGFNAGGLNVGVGFGRFYDPLFNYYRCADRNWAFGLPNVYNARYNGGLARPVTVINNTYVNNVTNITNNNTIINNRTTHLVGPVTSLDQQSWKLQNVPLTVRQQEQAVSRQVQGVAQQRSEREGRLTPPPPRPPITGQTANAPPTNYTPQSVKLDLPPARVNRPAPPVSVPPAPVPAARIPAPAPLGPVTTPAPRPALQPNTPTLPPANVNPQPAPRPITPAPQPTAPRPVPPVMPAPQPAPRPVTPAPQPQPAPRPAPPVMPAPQPAPRPITPAPTPAPRPVMPAPRPAVTPAPTPRPIAPAPRPAPRPAPSRP
jgi:hypothetical protein